MNLLVTPEELRTKQREELPALNDDTYADDIIAQAQGALEEYLGYDPFVHKEERFCPIWSPGDTYVPWTAHKHFPPVAQVDATSYEATLGYYTVTVSTGGKGIEVLTVDPLPTTVDLWVGWRSSRHDITGTDNNIDLTTLEGLDELTALPVEVPRPIREAICNAGLYFARYATNVGQRTYSVDMGTQIKTVESLSPLNDMKGSELRAIFNTLHRYKRELV